MIGRLEIVSYKEQYADDFARLNYWWIEKYFKIEPNDRLFLDNPHKMIIAKGGDILFVLNNKQVIGTCALIKVDNNRFELAKMAIDPGFHRKGIGKRLGQAVIERAKELGAKSIFLESNTILDSAISLYRKLGFNEIHGYESPYERSNIQMVLSLN